MKNFLPYIKMVKRLYGSAIMKEKNTYFTNAKAHFQYMI